MKNSLSLILAMAVLSGCQSVTSADLYKANFGRRALPASNFDPATITNGPYSPYNRKQSVCSYSAAPACAPNAQSQWENEFR